MQFNEHKQRIDEFFNQNPSDQCIVQFEKELKLILKSFLPILKVKEDRFGINYKNETVIEKGIVKYYDLDDYFNKKLNHYKN